MVDSGMGLFVLGEFDGGSHFQGDDGGYFFLALVIDFEQFLKVATTGGGGVCRDHEGKATLAAVTAQWMSAALPREIVAIGRAEEGLITAMNTCEAGGTHVPLM